MTKKYYKAFDKNLQCRGFQYEVGKTYTHDGDILICKSGFHSCENPLDVLNYYDLTDSRFCEVSIDGEIKTHAEDSKVVSQIISIDKELDLNEFIASCTDFINEDTQASSGLFSKQVASGDFSNQVASGLFSNQVASGNDSKQVASGYFSKQVASGYFSKQVASGDFSNQVASGDFSKQVASGDKSITMAVGNDGRIKTGKEGAMVLTWRDGKGRPRISVGYEGENGIKANTWYKLDNYGNFIECED